MTERKIRVRQLVKVTTKVWNIKIYALFKMIDWKRETSCALGAVGFWPKQTPVDLGDENYVAVDFLKKRRTDCECSRPSRTVKICEDPHFHPVQRELTWRSGE